MRHSDGQEYVRTLVFAALLGVPVAFAAVLFQTAIHDLIHLVWDVIPDELGWSEPSWWYVVLVPGLAGLLVAAAVRLPGHGGHSPLEGLGAEPIRPIELASILPAALATLGLGLVLGPEAPLIALGGGLGLLAARLVGKNAAPEVGQILAASATFAALSLIFGSPLIAAIILIEVTGLGGPRLTTILVPGLLAAGIGSLVSIGMGSFTGLSSSAYALDPLQLPAFSKPDLVDFLWTIPLAAGIALGTAAIFAAARPLVPLMERRGFVMLPAAGLFIGILALVFAEITDKLPDEVLFSGQDQLSGLISDAGSWSLGALALLIVLKGIGYAVSLAGFRGGPTFPAIFLGAVAGLAAAHLPGFAESQAVAVLVGATCVSVLRLPLSSVTIALLLTIEAGIAVGPLVIVSVVVAYLATLTLSAYAEERARARDDARAAEGAAEPPPAGPAPLPVG
jgi:H+/Cl- antiporter ClcA